MPEGFLTTNSETASQRGIFARWVTSVRGGNGQHNSPPNVFTSISALATSAPRRTYIYLLGSRGSKMEQGSPPKNGQAVLPAWWGIKHRKIILQQHQCLDCKSTANCSTVVQIVRSAHNSFHYGHCQYIGWLIIYGHTYIYIYTPVIYRLKNTIDYCDYI